MKVYFLIFIGIFISLYGAVNYYIGLRGWQLFACSLHYLNIKVYWIVFVIVAFSTIIGLTGKKFLPDFLRNGLNLIGSYWLAAMAYLVFLIVIIDLIRLLNSRIGFLPRVLKDNSAFSIILGLAVIIFVTILLVYGTWNARNIKVTSYNVNIPKQAGTLKQLHIVMLADLHLGSIADNRQERIIDVVNKLKADIVLIPGDLIDDIVPFVRQGMESDFKKIKSRYGVYASFGNHDNMSGSVEYTIEQFNKAGINVLKDDSVKVSESFYLVGREDKSNEMTSGKKRKELSSLMDGVDRNLPVIMLDHQPINIEEAKNAGVDLQLSGHTHQGQFFPFNLVTNKVFKTDYGYLKTRSLQVIVTSGAGTWGPPIRIGTSSEVVDIMVKFQ
jgi:uncharacterized protein